MAAGAPLVVVASLAQTGYPHTARSVGDYAESISIEQAHRLPVDPSVARTFCLVRPARSRETARQSPGSRVSRTRLGRTLDFEIRFWDAGDVVANLLCRYDQLSPGIQAELPLKRIWVQVPEAGGEEG